MLQTYVPLYRKYRPQTFGDLVGQEAISQTLSNAILHNKVAHAYLFTGPRGTGKTSSARILAKSLNCEAGPTVTPCGVCSSCKDITSGTALDVIEIDAASNNKVEDARELIDRVQFAPVSGRYKVYIIDEVHMLTPQAFNTLLKTLEEPPPNLVFILATTESHKVLETIISRCQRFDFRRISQSALVKRLKYIAEIENINITGESLSLIARRSAGGMRDALGLLDQISVLSSVGQTVDVKDVLNLIGALPEDMLIKVSKSIAEKDGAEILSLINELTSLGNEPLQIVKELTIHFRNLLIASSVEGDIKDLIDASEEFHDELSKQAKTFKQIEIAQIIDRLAYVERMIRGTTQQALWLEVGLLSICYRQEIFLVEELQKRVEELEKIVSSGGVSYSAASSYDRPVPVKPASRPVPVVKPIKPEIKEIKKEEVVDLKPEPKVVKPEVIEVKEKEVVQVENVEASKAPEIKQVVEKPAQPEIKEEQSSDEFKEYSVKETWDAIMDSITSPPIKGWLSSLVVPMAITSKEIVIGFAQEWMADEVRKFKREETLINAAQTIMGVKPRLTTKIISDTEFKDSQKKTQKNNSTVEEKKEPLKAPPARVESVSNSAIVDAPQEDNNGVSEEILETVAEELEQNVEVLIPQELSEQVGLIKDLLQGKVLNND